MPTEAPLTQLPPARNSCTQTEGGGGRFTSRSLRSRLGRTGVLPGRSRKRADFATGRITFKEDNLLYGQQEPFRSRDCRGNWSGVRLGFRLSGTGETTAQDN